MSITAIVENDIITLPPGLHVPDGTKVELTLLESTAAVSGPPLGAFSWMQPYLGVVDDLPSDLAAQHHHYLYGTAKKTS